MRLLDLVTRLLGSTFEDWMLDILMAAAVVLVVFGSRACYLHA